MYIKKALKAVHLIESYPLACTQPVQFFAVATVNAPSRVVFSLEINRLIYYGASVFRWSLVGPVLLCSPSKSISRVPWRLQLLVKARYDSSSSAAASIDPLISYNVPAPWCSWLAVFPARFYRERNRTNSFAFCSQPKRVASCRWNRSKAAENLELCVHNIGCQSFGVKRMQQHALVAVCMLC